LRDAIVKTGLPWRVRDKGTAIEMVLIPPGEFVMGKSPNDDEASDDESPAHEVKLTTAFYLGRYEVTQQQYAEGMGNNPSKFSEAEGVPSPIDPAMKGETAEKQAEQHAAEHLGVRGTARPVEQVSWNDCDAFCKKTKLRLPTEAEWEFACRAGQLTPRYGQLNEMAWHGGKAGKATHAVGTKRANGFGLNDMLGNVWGWVNDRWGDYSADAQTNPMGPVAGKSRVLRGGSWSSNSIVIRASNRLNRTPANSSDLIGFRAAKTP
ncbi:MAG: hypothetical protein EBR10_09810, partial [Planctomycetes bacterium]|nr:hypothetical protein [Planctomycetota bacterium]